MKKIKFIFALILIQFYFGLIVANGQVEIKTFSEYDWMSSINFQNLGSIHLEEAFSIIYADTLKLNNEYEFSNAISEKKIDGKYTNFPVNCSKNIIILCYYLELNNQLSFNLIGLEDTTRNSERINGGNIIIYAKKVVIKKKNALNFCTDAKSFTDNRGALFTTEEKNEKNFREGGKGGNILVVFEQIENQVILDPIKLYLDNELSHPDEKEILKFFFEPIVILGGLSLNDFKNNWIEMSQGELWNMYRYKALNDSRLQKLKQKFLELDEITAIVSSLKDLSDIYKYDIRYRIFFEILYTAEEIMYSEYQDFRKLNDEDNIINFNFLSWGRKKQIETPFVNFNASGGNDGIFNILRNGGYYFLQRKNENAEIKSRNGKFSYSNELNDIFKTNEFYRDFVSKWYIKILLKIRIQILESIKNKDRKLFIELIKKYDNLPHISIADCCRLEYGNFLNEINGYREKWKTAYYINKTDNVEIIEELKDENISYYSIPNIALIESFQLSGKEELGIFNSITKDNILSLDFICKLTNDCASLEFSKSLSENNNVTFNGVFTDWHVKNIKLLSEIGINTATSSIKIENNLMVLHLEFLNNSSLVPLSILFGSTGLPIKVEGACNRDSETTFDFTIYLSFQKRSTIREVNLTDNYLYNRNNHIIYVSGIELATKEIRKFNFPIMVPPHEKLEIKKTFATDIFNRVPPEYVNHDMKISLEQNKENFLFFNNHNLIRQITIFNNFSKLSEFSNKFISLNLKFEYDFNGTRNSIEVHLENPLEVFKIPFFNVSDQIWFEVSGNVLYENNEVRNFGPKVYESLQVFLDDNVFK